MCPPKIRRLAARAAFEVAGGGFSAKVGTEAESGIYTDVDDDGGQGSSVDATRTSPGPGPPVEAPSCPAQFREV